MYKLLFFLVAICYTHTSQAQINFDVLLNKKKLKRLKHKTYTYYKTIKLDCTKGDCKNGTGIFKVYYHSYSIHIIAKGQFKNGKLNGPGAIYLFNCNKANNCYNVGSFIRKLRQNEDADYNVFEYLSPAKPDESFVGTFKDNVFISGTYEYYGDLKYKHRQFTPIAFPYLSNINPEEREDKRLFTYKYQGSMQSGADGKITPVLKSATDYIELTHYKGRVLIKPDENKKGFSCTAYSARGKVLSNKILRGTEGQSEELSMKEVLAARAEKEKKERAQRVQLSRKFATGMIIRDKEKNTYLEIVKIRDDGCLMLNSAKIQSYNGSQKTCDLKKYTLSSYKKRCNSCNGKCEFKRRVWVIRTFERRAGNNGYGKNVLVNTTYAEYLKGARAPETYPGRTAKVEDVKFKCSKCNGIGFTK